MGRPVHSLMVAIVGIGPANTASAYEHRWSINSWYCIKGLYTYFIFTDI